MTNDNISSENNNINNENFGRYDPLGPITKRQL